MASQHDQSGRNTIKVVHMWTSTCHRVLWVRVVQHDQSMIKAYGLLNQKHNQCSASDQLLPTTYSFPTTPPNPSSANTIRVMVLQYNQSGTNIDKLLPYRVRVMQHNQNGANSIKVVHTWTSTHLRVLRVRAAPGPEFVNIFKTPFL